MIKAAVVLIVGGLAGSSIVALTSSLHESQPNVLARQEITAPTSVSHSPDETGQLGYIQARFAVQRPFAALCVVSR